MGARAARASVAFLPPARYHYSLHRQGLRYYWPVQRYRSSLRKVTSLSRQAKQRKVESRERHIADTILVVALLAVPLAAAFVLSATGHTLLPSTYLSGLGPWKTAQGPAVGWDSLLWDGMAQFYPWRAFGFRWFARGVLPLWNPHQFCGTPFLANGQSALLYPPNWLFAVLPTEYAFAWSAALHLAFAAVFTFLLLRLLACTRRGALLGAVAFPLNGFFALWIHLPTAVQSACWLPFLCYAAERLRDSPKPRWAGLAAVGVAGAVLAGHLQMAFYVLATFSLWSVVGACCASASVRWKVLAYCVSALALGGLICAAQLLPSSELAAWSQRGASKSMETFRGYLQFALPPAQLITLALPWAMGRTPDGDYWGRGTPSEYALYVGALVLLLAFWSRPAVNRRAWWLAVGLAGFSLLSALGTWINALLFFLVPGFERLGGPARILVLWPFALALLAAMGASRAEQGNEEGLRRTGAFGLTAYVVCLVLVSLPLLVLAGKAGLRLIGQSGAADLRSILFLLLALLVGLAMVGKASARRRTLVTVLPLLLLADLGTFWAGSVLIGRSGSAYPTNPVVEEVRRSGSEARVLALTDEWPLNRYPRAAFPPNAAMAYGIDDVQGYDSLFIGRYKDLLAEFLGRDPSPPACGNMVLVPASAALSQAATRFFSVTCFMRTDGSVVGGTRSGDTVVFPVRSPARVYRSEASKVLADEMSVLAALPSAWGVPDRPRPTLLFGEASELQGKPGWEPLDWERPQPNLLRASTTGAGEALVVTRETYCPGWRAYVDGAHAPLLRADFLFRAVPVSPGAHSVMLVYDPVSFRVGMFVTLLGLGLLVAVLAASNGGGSNARAG